MSLLSVPRIAVDESGNTGEDLLNADQPTFVLASTSLTDEAAIALLESAGGHRNVELKHSDLRTSASGRQQIARVVRALTPENAKVIVISKRFMVVAKMVDDLLEPLASSTDFNLYGRGAHAALTEAWSRVLPAVMGEERYRELLERFVIMCRKPDPSTIDAFYTYLDETRTGTAEVDKDLVLLGVTRDIIEPSFESRLRDGLDPAIPALFDTANEWGESLGVPFVIDHDEAAVIARWYPHFSRFFFSGGSRVRIGTGKRASWLPLLVTDVKLVSSQSNHAVQIVDVLAGATRRWIDNIVTGQRPLPDDVGEDDLQPFIFNAVWPTGDLTPDETALQSVNPIDDAARFLADRRSLGP